jgi:hypothetical protein
MGKGRDFGIGKAAELIADHFQFFIQTRGPECRTALVVLHQRHKPHAGGIGIAMRHQGGAGVIRGRGDPDILQAGNLAL